MVMIFWYPGFTEYGIWCNSSNTNLLNLASPSMYSQSLYNINPSSSIQYPSYFLPTRSTKSYSLTWRENSLLAMASRVLALKSIWVVLMASMWLLLLRVASTLFSFPFTCFISNSNSHRKSIHMACQAFRFGWLNKYFKIR